MIGPSLDGVSHPALFTTDTLIPANDPFTARIIVFRGWVVSQTAQNWMDAELDDTQPAFDSYCYNPISSGGVPCYGTVPIYPLPNSFGTDGTPGPGYFFVSFVVPLVDVPIGSNFSLTASVGSPSLVYAIGELYTGTVTTPGGIGLVAATSGTSSGVVIGDTFTMTNVVSVPSNSSMALTAQYTDTSTTCCVKCGSINALFASGDAAADGAWDAANTDATWNDTFGAVYQSCRSCTGYAPNRDRDYRVMLGHASVTPSGSYTLTGTATTPNGTNQCLVGGNPDTRPRTGQRQTVFLLTDHDPLACCPPAPPPYVLPQGRMSVQAGDALQGAGDGSENPAGAYGKVWFWPG